MQFVFEFLLSVINHYDINGLHIFWDSFEWFCLQISSDANYFFLPCPRHYDRGLIDVTVHNFQIWNKKEHIINSHMSLIYIETPYIRPNYYTNV